MQNTKMFLKISCNLICAGIVLLLLINCKTNDIVKTTQQDLTIEQQIEEIMRMWPGVYNNDRQIAKVIKEGKDVWKVDGTGEDGYLQIQSHYVKLDLPWIGDNVLYVEEYRDHEPDSTYRQRIYSLEVDSASQKIKVVMWPFKDKKKYIGAWKHPEVLKKMKEEEVFPYPSICDMYVTKIGDKYNMKFDGKKCAFGDKCFNYEVMLSRDMFSYRDKITLLSTGEVITTAANFAYHDLDRVK